MSGWGGGGGWRRKQLLPIAEGCGDYCDSSSPGGGGGCGIVGGAKCTEEGGVVCEDVGEKDPREGGEGRGGQVNSRGGINL